MPVAVGAVKKATLAREPSDGADRSQARLAAFSVW